MLCDPLAHLLGDGLDRAILKGNLQPGGLHQLCVAGQTGTAHQLEVAFPGILVVLEAQQEELQRCHGGQAVINIVEGALIDVELTLPAGTAAIEGQVVEIDPGAVLVLQFQPDGVALVRGEVGVLVHPVLELVHDAAIGQEEEAVLGVEQGVFLSVLAKEQMVPGSRQELHGHGVDLGAFHGGAFQIGAFQAVVGSSKFRFSYYITGILILLGVLLGRFICGFLCPFGWLQELLHKIPSPKCSTKRLKPLRYLKYAVLLIMVVLLPALVVNEMGMGDPFFCKYLCPQGVLEGAIPLSLTNAGIRAALGKLFSWKLCILLAVVVASVVFYRPFCKWLCPLGAFYAVMNRVSLFQMRVDTDKCVSCGACARACKMDVDITKTPNHAECIRCGMCIKSCPTKAIHYQYGFGDKADNSKEI